MARDYFKGDNHKSAAVGIFLRAGALCLIVCLNSGCPARKAAMPVALNLAGATPGVDYSDLSAVLAKAVDGKGKLVPQAAGELSARLEGQLCRLAVTGPTVTPELFADRDACLAYWLNARAAWAIRLAELAGWPRELPASELEDRPFVLDGRTMTLREIDRALMELGNWQAVAAGPCVLLQRAGLPRRPFEAGDVRGRIGQRLNELVDDGERFVVDVEAMAVRFPPVLWSLRSEILEDHRRSYGAEGATLVSALLPHLAGSAHRRMQDAIGYRCVAARPGRAVAISRGW